jgi:hypothetical protein
VCKACVLLRANIFSRAGKCKPAHTFVATDSGKNKSGITRWACFILLAYLFKRICATAVYHELQNEAQVEPIYGFCNIPIALTSVMAF